ncbi:hypothetical protein [Ideonella sp.]|nr:hypothetical protein [Ideonella sp.]HJV71319.1 hypothetical protein [Ideonella sp.]
MRSLRAARSVDIDESLLGLLLELSIVELLGLVLLGVEVLVLVLLS